MEVLDLYPHGEKNHSPQPLAKKNNKHFSKRLVPFVLLTITTHWWLAVCSMNIFCTSGNWCPIGKSFTKKAGSDFCHRRSRINYIYPHGQLRSYLSSRHPLIATAWSQSDHQKLGPVWVWQVHATCPHRSQADVMPLWHCVRENFSELLKIRSFSVKNCTNDQEKQEQTRSNSHLPVGNVSNQYKGNTEKKKNLQTALIDNASVQILLDLQAAMVSMHLRLQELSLSFVTDSPRLLATTFFKPAWHLGSTFPNCSRLAKCISWTKRFGLMGGCSESYSVQEWKEFRKGRKSSTSWVSSLNSSGRLSSSHSGMSSDSWHSRTGELLTSLSPMKETSGSVISGARSLTGLHGAGIKAKEDMAGVGDWDNETAVRFSTKLRCVRLRKIGGRSLHFVPCVSNGKKWPKKSRKHEKIAVCSMNICLVILCDLFGMVKWPF